MNLFLKTDVHILDPKRDSSITKHRLLLATILILFLTAVILGRLYFLQVVKHDRYRTLSVENRIGLLPVPPVRGRIFDRNGEILAENYPVYELEIVPDQTLDLERTVQELNDLISLSSTELDRFDRLLKMRPSFEPRLLKHSLSYEEASLIAVNQYRFPGVALRASLRRFYPFAGLASHAVGYVSRISEEDLRQIDRSAYRGTRYIGQVGIEAQYEDKLLGVAGYETVEFNAHSRIVRSLDQRSPMSGWNVHLTLDVALQKVAREALGDHRGAVVAIRPQTGDVLVFVSAPDYDPNLFASGFGSNSYEDLRTSLDKPLLNRALYGRYTPGSTIKPILALGAMNYGLDPKKTFFCGGSFKLSGRDQPYRCWNRDGHGNLNLIQAIEESCDSFFYQLALDLGIEKMSSWLHKFGFGETTGIDLNDEPSGLVPSRDWKRRIRGEAWFPGETVIAGIGQGYLLATPLQLAVATAAIANRGKLVQPRLLSRLENLETGDIVAGPEVRITAKSVVDASLFDTVIQGMIAVVHGARGTARASGKGAAYQIAGKTGTSQLISIGQNEDYDLNSVPERLRDHSLYIAFAPVERPRIALAVVVENAGSGSRTAAPIARKILDYYFIERLRRAAVTRRVNDFG
jgi:penicillin-binding protein 2